MAEIWRESLEGVAGKFQQLALTWPNIEHRVFVCNWYWPGQEDAQPKLPSVADGFGTGLDESYHFWSEESPKVWWHCQVRNRFDPSDTDGYRAFLESAKHAGRIAQAIPGCRSLIPQCDIRDDDLWTYILYRTAWRELDGTPLRTWTDLVTEKGFHRVKPPQPHEPIPFGLRSELAIDLFSACMYAVKVLIAENSEHDERRRTRQGNVAENAGRLYFDEEGHLHQVGVVPVSRYLDEVGVQLNRFLTRLATCQKTKSGDYLMRDPTAGRLRGVQILWENTERVVQASISMLVVAPKWDEMMLEAQRNDGIAIRAGLLPPRTSQAVVDLLTQVLFALPRNGAGEWPKEVSTTAVDKLRLLAKELPDYRDQFLLHERGVVQMMTNPSESTPFEVLAATARIVCGLGDRATDTGLWNDAMALYRADPTLPVLPVRADNVLANLTNLQTWAIEAGEKCMPSPTDPQQGAGNGGQATAQPKKPWWTRAQLIRKTDPQIGGTTFDRIRKVAKLPAGQKGKRGRKFFIEDIRCMLDVVEVAAPDCVEAVRKGWMPLVADQK